MNIVDEVKKLASEVQKSPSQVALAWLLSRSTVTSVLLGASTLDQLESNLGSLNTHLSPDQTTADDISRIAMATRTNISRTQRFSSISELKSAVNSSAGQLSGGL
jgi:aryl-alcohol dehydrogenase-like predicted oxidoreductase